MGNWCVGLVATSIIGILCNLFANDLAEMIAKRSPRLARWAADRWSGDPRLGDEWSARVASTTGSLPKLGLAALLLLSALRRYAAPRLISWLTNKVDGLRTRRLSVVALVLIATVAAANAILFAAPGAALAAPAPLLRAGSNPVAADRQWIGRLAAQVAADAGTGKSADPIQYLHIQKWSLDVQRQAGHPSEIFARDLKTWKFQDMSAHTEVTHLPAQPAGLRSAQFVATLPSGLNVDKTSYPPGAMPLTIVHGPSHIPEILAGQLAWLDRSSTNAILRSIAAVASEHQLDLKRRAAILRVLADTDQLLYWGTITDRAGRTGVALSVDSGPFRDLLIINGQTGEILSHETVYLTPPRRSSIPRGTVMSYSIFL